jgi:putative radical SAM enzyme (TIGR03279 family)
MGLSADYGRHVPEPVGGGVVASVDAGSPAARAGIVPGDVIVSVDGEPLRDIIDWRWLSDGPQVCLAVRSRGVDGAGIELNRVAGETWGIEFRDAVFDGVRTCRNRCAFCFMTQLPAGLRRALYLRDDDYRLSFLQGNFVTLTNVDDADVERIVDQHLSPLYVSVHAVDAEVRQQLVSAREDHALARLDDLLGEGIDVHAQIVLVPGVNDGAELDRTLDWLARREGVLSVGIVPLGYTRHQESFGRSYETPDAAAAVIEQVAPWQEAMRVRDGLGWVYLADEFYLQARRPLPSAEEYDGFPQLENGIGMVRTFVDGVRRHSHELRGALEAIPPGRPVIVATGELFAPVLQAEFTALGVGDAAVQVVAVENRLFGGNVTVAGLLSARDLVSALRDTPSAALVLLPDSIANADGLLLDDVPASELGTALGREVRLLSCDAGGLLEGLRAAAAGPQASKE